MIYHVDKEPLKVAHNYDKAKEEKGFTYSAIDNVPRDDEEPDQVLDQFLSGYYIIESIDISYKSPIGNFTQKVTLTRREWPARMSAI